jgi:protein-S-isoprenylcysteine O-methyltransferase Ste14
MKKSQLLKMALIRLILGLLILMTMFFLPAGTFAYWHAWIYIALILIPMCVSFLMLIRKDPDLLERRLRMKEKKSHQKLLIRISWIIFLIAFIIPGFDFRFGWSHIPIWVVICAYIFILAGYIFFIFVMKENSYASRIIEVEKGQKVIDTGPYAFMRHPLYLSNLIIYLGTPIALGSFWALIAILPLPVVIIFRLLDEEKTLQKDLPGYTDYMSEVKYRLIPLIW